MSDVEHEQIFVVRVPAFGDPETEAARLLLLLARTLHHGVKAGVSVAPARTTGHYFACSGPWWTLDPLGDDMGHHGDEHPAPLIIVDSIEPS